MQTVPMNPSPERDSHLAQTDAARPRRARDPDGGEAAFAALVSTLRMGYGTNNLAHHTRAAAQRAFSSQDKSDARQRRIDQMTLTAREEARQSTGRKAAISDSPEARELGGRAQRLAAQRAAAADPRASRTREPATAFPGPNETKTTATRPNEAEGIRSGSDVREGGSSVRQDAQPSFRLDRSGAGRPARTDTGMSLPPSAAQASPDKLGPEPAIPVSSAVARVRAGAGSARPTDPLARQIAQLLSTKTEGPAGARIGDGPAMARSAPRPAGSAAPDVGGPKPGASVRAEAANAAARTAFERLVSNIRMNIGPRQSTAKIRLHPPELGRLLVDVRMADSRIELRVEVENPTARELISERLEALRTALRDHGLVTERLDLVEQRAEHQGAALADGGQKREAADQTAAFEGWAGDRDGRSAKGDESGSSSQSENEEQDDETLVAVLDARLDIHI